MGFGPLAMTALMHPRTLFGKIRDTAGSVARFTKTGAEPLSPILKSRSIQPDPVIVVPASERQTGVRQTGVRQQGFGGGG